MEFELLTPFLKAYLISILAVLGLCMGSFLNCTAGRLCAGISVIKGRSVCDSCAHTLSARDLIPVLSWLFSGGRCRYCGTKISIQYPISEIISALVYVSAFIRYGLSLQLLQYLILASLLLCISFADIDDYIIPDLLIIIGICVRGVFVLLSGNIPHTALQSVIGGFSISLPLLIIVLIAEKVMNKEAMGGGDIKLLFMTGLYYSWQINLCGILFACIIGIISGVILNSKKPSDEPRLIPFGPSIAAGIWLAGLFGEKLIQLYLSLF